MNMKIFKFIAIMLVLAGSWASCNKNTLDESNIDMSKIDFSNIDDLHAQPLPVIQKCVEGEWKWIAYSTYGFIGLWYPTNTFINITNDSVVVTGDDNLNEAFSYSWEKKKTSAKLANYTTYVMWNNEQHSGEWFFDSIQNDTLVVLNDKINSGGYNDSYLFLRIK